MRGAIHIHLDRVVVSAAKPQHAVGDLRVPAAGWKRLRAASTW